MHLQLSDNHYKNVNRMRSFVPRGPTLARRGNVARRRGPGGRDSRSAEPCGRIDISARLAHLAGTREGARLSKRPGGRSEERRVGKECRSRWWEYDGEKKV